MLPFLIFASFELKGLDGGNEISAGYQLNFRPFLSYLV